MPMPSNALRTFRSAAPTVTTSGGYYLVLEYRESGGRSAQVEVGVVLSDEPVDLQAARALFSGRTIDANRWAAGRVLATPAFKLTIAQESKVKAEAAIKGWFNAVYAEFKGVVTGANKFRNVTFGTAPVARPPSRAATAVDSPPRRQAPARAPSVRVPTVRVRDMRTTWKAAKKEATGIAKGHDKRSKKKQTTKYGRVGEYAPLGDDIAPQLPALKALRFPGGFGPALDTVTKHKANPDKGIKAAREALLLAQTYGDLIERSDALDATVSAPMLGALRGIAAALRGVLTDLDAALRSEVDVSSGRTKERGGVVYEELGGGGPTRLTPLVLLEDPRFMGRLRNRAVAERLGFVDMDVSIDIADKGSLDLIEKSESLLLRQRMVEAADLSQVARDVDQAIGRVDEGDPGAARDAILDAIEAAREAAVVRAFAEASDLDRQIRAIRSYRLKKAAKVVQVVAVTSVTVATGFTTGAAAVIAVAVATARLANMAVQESKSNQTLVGEIEQALENLLRQLRSKSTDLARLGAVAQDVLRSSFNELIGGMDAFDSIPGVKEKMGTAMQNHRKLDVYNNELSRKLETALRQAQGMSSALRGADQLPAETRRELGVQLRTVEAKVQQTIQQVMMGVAKHEAFGKRLVGASDLLNQLDERSDLGKWTNRAVAISRIVTPMALSSAFSSQIEALGVVQTDALALTNVGGELKQKAIDLMPG